MENNEIVNEIVLLLVKELKTVNKRNGELENELAELVSVDFYYKIECRYSSSTLSFITPWAETYPKTSLPSHYREA